MRRDGGDCRGDGAAERLPADQQQCRHLGPRRWQFRRPILMRPISRDAWGAAARPRVSMRSGVLTSAANRQPAEITSAPLSLSATVNGNIVVLSWTTPASGGPVLTYTIEAGSAPGLTNLASFNTGNASTSLTVPGVPNGTYYVRVRALDASGPKPSFQRSHRLSLALLGRVPDPRAACRSHRKAQARFRWRGRRLRRAPRLHM